MAVKRVPTGFRILIGAAIFILTFLLARPSDPATQGQIVFWKKAAGWFGEADVEGFVGITLLAICSLVTIAGYQVIIRIIDRKLKSKA